MDRSVLKECGAALVLCLVLGSGLCALAGEGPPSIVTFGAVGDGRTDNTQAIQQALDSGMKSLLVPAGRFATGPITMRDGQRLHGEGAASVLVLNTANRTPHLLKTASHCRIENLTLTSGDEQIEHSSNEEPALIFIYRQTHVTVKDVRFRDFPYTGANCRESDDLMFLDNRLENMNEAMRFRRCRRVNASGNVIREMKMHGIEFWGHHRDYPNKKFTVMGCEDLIFTNNYIYRGGGGAIWGTAARRVVIANNVIDTAHDIGLDPEWCEDVTIVGNTIRNCETAGIALFLSCRNVAITGNTIIGKGPKPWEHPFAAMEP